MTILYFILALGILIFIHEFGHFLAAKKQGIGVEKFSLGFGPKLFGFQKGETTYMISALPFGGYVKLKGEEPDASQPGDPTDYSARPLSHRFRVVFAGPFMNILLALFLMPLVFLIGRSEPVFWQEPPVVIGIQKNSPAEQAGLQVGDRIVSLNGREVALWKELLDRIVLKSGETVILEIDRGGDPLQQTLSVAEEPNLGSGYLGVEPHYFIGNETIIDEVLSGSPAEKAGLREGDQFQSINGVAVNGWIEMAETIHQSGGKPLKIEVLRSGAVENFEVQPEEEKSGYWVIGIRKDYEKHGIPLVVRRYPLFESLRQGVTESWRLSRMTVEFLGRLLSFRLSYKNLGGPIRIAQASAAAAKSGLSHFLYFLAFLSLQLGVLNLLPFPVLDGGHLLFMGIEAVSGRPLSSRIRSGAEQVGFFLLISLMILVTLHDIDSVWGFSHLFEKVKGFF